MAQGLNKVLLIGHLGTDPETRYTQGNQAVAKFRLATSESYKDRSGTQQKRTEWHSVVAWGRTAETVGRYLRKGRQVYVEGRIQTRQWEDREGKKRYTTEVVAQRVLFLGGRGDAEAPAAEADAKPAAEEGFGDVMDPFSSDFEGSGGGKESSPAGPSKDDDDDMPF
jgi:single-strand DNA-binding protein